MSNLVDRLQKNSTIRETAVLSDSKFFKILTMVSDDK